MPEISLRTLIELVLAIVRDFVRVWFQPHLQLVAENLFLRRQLALYQERKTRRRRPTPAVKFALIVLRPILPLAGGVVDRKTRHVCPLAPRRFSMVLAVKVETRWSTPDSTLFAGAAGDDGSGESDLGRRADRR